MKKIARLVLLIGLLFLFLAACSGPDGPEGPIAPAAAEEAAAPAIHYINVAGNHPKTLTIVTGGPQEFVNCPSWITAPSMGSLETTFAPNLDVPEGNYTCDIDTSFEIVRLVVTVSQVEPIPHHEYSFIVEVVAGKETWITMSEVSEIFSGNAGYEFTDLQSWMSAAEMPAIATGMVLVNPPADLVGQTFSFTAEGTDFVNLSATETIVVTVSVVE